MEPYGRHIKRKFIVRITETLAMDVTVEADYPDEAKDIVGKKWANEEYNLDGENLVGAEFEVLEEVEQL